MLRDLFDMTNHSGRNDITRWGSWTHPSHGLGERSNRQGLIPAIDVEETKQAFFLTADMPGLKEDEISIEVNERTLTISGERATASSTKEDSGRQMNRTERHYGHFMRAFTLPDSVNTDEIMADYENGVLSLTLPKRELQKEEGRRIPLNSKKNKQKH